MSHRQHHPQILRLAQNRQPQQRDKEGDKAQIQPPEVGVPKPLHILVVHGRGSVPVVVLFRVGRPVPAVPVCAPVESKKKEKGEERGGSEFGMFRKNV